MSRNCSSSNPRKANFHFQEDDEILSIRVSNVRLVSGKNSVVKKLINPRVAECQHYVRSHRATGRPRCS